MSIIRNARMPWPSSRDAPSFTSTGDIDEAIQLFRFISNVETCFKDAAVTAEQDKKQWLSRYASPSDEEVWRSLETFAEPTTYEEWKEDILKGYPTAEEFKSGSLYVLEHICKMYKNVSDNEQARVIGFQRKFKVEADKLSRPPALCTNRELAAKFLGALDPEFTQRVLARMEIEASIALQLTATRAAAEEEEEVADPATVSTRRREDKYDLKDIMATAIDMVSGQYLRERSATVGAPAISTAFQQEIKLSSTFMVELETMQQQIAGLADRFNIVERQQSSSFESIMNILTQ